MKKFYKNLTYNKNPNMEEKKQIPKTPPVGEEKAPRQTRGQLYTEVRDLAIMLGRTTPDYTRTSMDRLREYRTELQNYQTTILPATTIRIGRLNEKSRSRLWNQYKNEGLTGLNYRNASANDLRNALIQEELRRNRTIAPALNELQNKRVGVRVSIPYLITRPNGTSVKYIKTFLINSVFKDIENNVSRLEERFFGERLSEYGKPDSDTTYSLITKIPEHTYMTVPLKYSKAPKLEIFNENGNIVLDNINYNDDLCIPHYIQDNIFTKKPLEKIITEINAVVNEWISNLKEDDNAVLPFNFANGKKPKEYDCKTEGVSLQQFQMYCEKYRLSFRALDYTLTEFHKFHHHNVSHHHPVMMFIIHDGHIYNISDKITRESIRNTGNNTQVHKNIKNSKKEKAKKENSKKPEQRAESSIPNRILEFYENSINEAIKNKFNINFYTTDQREIINYFFKRYSQGTYITHKSLGHDMVSCNYRVGCKIYYNPEWKEAKQLCDTLKIEFKNHSMTSIAYDKLLKLSGCESADICLNQFKSYFNDTTLKFVQCMDSRAIVKQFNPYTNKDNILSLDINKLYTSILEDNSTEWLLLNSLDTVKPFIGGKTPLRNNRLYYIEPSRESEGQKILFPIAGVYLWSLVNKGLEDKIISLEDIKYYVDCGSVKTELFKSFVKDVYSTCGEFAKNLINNFIGSLGRVSKQKGSIYYTNDINTACSNFFIRDETRFVSKVYSPEEGKPIYATDNIEMVDNNRNLFLIRKQIVQTGNLRAYKLRQAMKGNLIKISTDCVSVEYETLEEKQNMLSKTHLSTHRGGYKVESKLPVMSKHLGDDDISRNKFTLSAITQQILSVKNERDFNEIFQVVENKSFFLEGLGGTGKSFIGIQLKEKYEQLGKRVLCVAPTHIATKTMDGKTCHKGFGYNVCGKSHVSDYKNVDVIIIDEISMMGITFYNELCEIKKDYSDIIFICLGDFTQLPPVEEEETDFKNSTAFTSLFPYRLTLKENKRNTLDGQELFALTEKILRGEDVRDNFENIDDFDEAVLNYDRHLTMTNKLRKQINELKMEAYKSDDSLFIEMEEQKIKSLEDIAQYAQSMWIYNGLPLRCRRTIKQNGKEICHNGDSFRVIDFSTETGSITLERDNSTFSNFNPDDEKERVLIPIDKNFIINFNPNYAMTVHNSQCQSFDFPYVIHESHRYSEKMLNTAIGRTRKMSNVIFVSHVILREEEMFLYEPVNMEKLKIIKDNFETLYKRGALGRFVSAQNGYKQITDMKTIKSIIDDYYDRKTITDKIEYRYSKNNEKGRMFSKGHSLQNISRKIRGCISKGIYTDLDIVNCHMMILQKYCDDNKINCDNLNSYITDREPKLKDLMAILDIDRDSAKTIPLSLINGGKGYIMKGDIKVGIHPDSEPEWMKGLKLEAKNAYEHLITTPRGIDLYNKISRVKRWNIQGSVLNNYFCQEENKLLTCIYRFLSSIDIKVGTFVFDGLMIKNDSINNSISMDLLLENMEEEIYKKLRYKIKLSYKEFEDVDLSEFL